MNKKVFVSMLTLCVVFLVGLYIAKIFFPQEFMMSIQNERVIKVGTFIDNHKWLFYICGAITAFITYWLYCCASSGRKYLYWYECLEILAVILSIRLLSFYDDNIASILEITSFFFLPAIMKGNINNCAISFTIHGISQGLSLTIRSLPIYLRTFNFATKFVIGLESYLWLVLLYIIFNNKENKKEI